MTLFSPPVLSKILALNLVDALYIDQFNLANDEKKHQLIRDTTFDVVLRISCRHKAFEQHCERPEFNGYWTKKWCAYGFVLSLQEQLEPVLFYSQPNANQFNLARGAYFFHLANQVKCEMKSDFMYSEMEFVQMAVKHGSVHGIQRYNEFIYHKLGSIKNADVDKTVLFNELIVNSKRMLPASGSYGYMVLAEAYSNYALWLLETNHVGEAKKKLANALSSLEYAGAILESSQYSISNASLGRGLKTSNGLNIDNPEDAKKMLQKAFDELLITVENRSQLGQNPG